MVCVAAFIILLVIWLFTPILRLFGFRKQADAIGGMFKKSTACFTKRVTLQACDSNFKDEIKNSVLQKLIIRHKKWVKPVSVGIEIASMVIILITIWSLLTVVKSGLALYVYGTCDVRRPNACSLSAAEACSIDSAGSGNFVIDWFDEWREIFEAFPAKLTTWRAEDFVPKNATFYGQFDGAKPDKTAIDIFDPGCLVCRQSFEIQFKSGFFKQYKTYLLPYVIRDASGEKFDNSELLARYFEALRGERLTGKQKSAEWFLAEKLFIDKNEKGIRWQEFFNGLGGQKINPEMAEKVVHEWLVQAGLSLDKIQQIQHKARSEATTKLIEANRILVEQKIKTKRIPTMIFDGQRHEGLYRLNK